MIHDVQAYTRLHLLASLEAFKQLRAAYKWSHEEAVTPIATIITLDGQAQVSPVPHRNDEEKHAVMQALADHARKLNAVAVIVASDARWANAYEIQKEFNLPDPHRNLESFKSAYLNLLHGRFGGELKNLPRHLWQDAVIAMVKGPTIKDDALMQKYTQGPNDTVKWNGEPEKHDGAHVYVIPDWWH